MPKVKNLLVPGGAGFVGSNTLVQILQNTDIKTVVIDDFSNCYNDVLQRVEKIVSKKLTKQQFGSRVRFHKGNILDLQFLNSLFKRYEENGEPIDGIMHFAAKKCVGQSFQIPMDYFENNFVGSMNLLKMMQKYKSCQNFIFSSSCSVYGDKDGAQQDQIKNANCPYGDSKACVEMLMSALIHPHPNWRIVSLRYFNPIGAHESGLIGDQPSNYPTNLIPYIQEVIAGKRDSLKVFGNDYSTPDGTCVRDYIHITDIAIGHRLALQHLHQMPGGLQVVNLGSGIGYSVLQVLKSMEKAYGKPIKHQISERRKGDVAKIVANASKAKKVLGWEAHRDLDKMCQDAMRFTNYRFSLANKQ